MKSPAAADTHFRLENPKQATAMRIGWTGALRVCIPAAVLALLPTHSTSAQSAALVCHPPQRPANLAELMFGRDIGGRVAVSEAAWTRFLVREVSPRFPDGLTVTSARGQWRDRSTGAIIHEPSKLVSIVLPGNQDDQARLEAIAAAYKRRFHQQSVVIVEQPVCVSF
jgi:Protein of unknown function (DUF3574)